jgi:hypothetical protein
MLGADVAANMLLQANVNGDWRTLIDVPSQGGVMIQFATSIKADE